MFIVGIDVGGTFTDLTAVDEAAGRVVVTKVPSEPRNEAAAVLSGLRALGIAGRDVRRLVHGTTVGTNAVLERRGARVAILTTAGFRDLIEIGRTKRNIPALFVPTFVRPKPVVERKHRFEVGERLAADGAVLVPLDGASVVTSRVVTGLVQVLFRQPRPGCVAHRTSLCSVATTTPSIWTLRPTCGLVAPAPWMSWMKVAGSPQPNWNGCSTVRSHSAWHRRPCCQAPAGATGPGVTCSL